MKYPPELPIEEVLHQERCRLAYKLSEARGFGRAEEDWHMACAILGDKNWQGTGISYEEVLRRYYYANKPKTT